MKTGTAFLFLLGIALGQTTDRYDVRLKNWAAPLYWQPSQTEAEAGHLRGELRTPAPEAATPAGSLMFVAMTPCRVVDTRASQMFPAPFGPPSLAANATRSFPIQSSTLCTIPSSAMAYSFNVTVVPPAGLGYLTIWPTGLSQPNAVTLDDITGDIRNNAAIVPAGTPNGSVDVHVNANTELVIDINGYYAPSSGITLAQGTAGAPSLSFSGDAGTGVFSSGAGTLNFATGGTNRVTVRADGDLDLAGNIRKSGTLFLHNLGGVNTGVGLGALGSNTAGVNNTAVGYQALISNTSGSHNTASGLNALVSNTTGSGNVAAGAGALQNNNGDHNAAVGAAALYGNTTGTFNTANGDSALFSNSTGSQNTASGANALINNTTGYYNTAFGGGAGMNIADGSNNINIGFNAGSNNFNGSNNIDIGNAGSSADNGAIRIGTSLGVSLDRINTAFFAAGIRGVTTGNNNAIPVMIDSAGQLGTASSSRRYKEDIQDMADASSGLLRLRPVTFRYQKPYVDGSKPMDYGLIAEEVAEVYPDLVVKNVEGQVETVQYQKLLPMLLNELQKQNETNQSQQVQITALQKALGSLLSERSARPVNQ